MALKPREESARDKRRDHTARRGIVLGTGKRQQNGRCGISRTCREQRHCSVGDAHHAGDTAESRRPAELTSGVVADQNGQVRKECPPHRANALIPPCTSESITRGHIDHVADTVDEAGGDDTRKQRYEHVSDFLQKCLHRLALVLGLLRRLVLGGRRNDVFLNRPLSDAREFGELVKHLVDLARTEHDLHRIVLDQAHHAVRGLDARGINLGHVAHRHAQARHARRIG